MFKAIKDFSVDCARIGSFYAHLTTPKILHPISIPLIAITAAPVMKTVVAINEYKYERDIKRKIAKHQNIGEKEQSIRQIFGHTSINGFIGDDVSIAMEFNEASLYLITPENKAIDIKVEGYGNSRDAAVESLLGRIALDVDPNKESHVSPRDDGYAYFLATHETDDMKPQFYTAAEIHTAEDAANLNAIVTASHLGFGQLEKERKHFAFFPVDPQTQARLEAAEFIPRVEV